MKKSLFIIILSVILFSCQQDELEFSCDPLVNKFVVENREELSQITVNELVSYGTILQRAIFNSWDYQKKRDVWIEKFHYILDNEILADPEKAHIQKLIGHIRPDYFIDKDKQKTELHSQFATEWISYAINALGWNDQFIAFTVFRLYTEQYQLETELSMLKSIGMVTSTNSESVMCDCNMSSDYCGLVSSCNSGGCTTTYGCGWLWSESCNGRCY